MRHERGHSRKSQRVHKGTSLLPSVSGNILADTASSIGDANASTQDTSVDAFQQQHDSLGVRSENPDHSMSSPSYDTPRQMTFTSYLAADTVDAPDLQLGWDASHDAEMRDFEAAYCDPFWFIGDSFCLDALHSSLSAAASPKVSAGPPDIPPNSISRLSSPLCPTLIRTVQSCWYTTPNANDAPLLSLASLRNQDQVDDAYRTGLRSRLTIHPHDDTLPSVDFLVIFHPPLSFLCFSNGRVDDLI